MVEVREKFRVLGTGKHFESRATCPGGHCYIETPLDWRGLENRSCILSGMGLNRGTYRAYRALVPLWGGGCSLSRCASLSAGRQGSSHAWQGTQNARYVFLRCTLHQGKKVTVLYIVVTRHGQHGSPSPVSFLYKLPRIAAGIPNRMLIAAEPEIHPLTR